MGRDTIQLENAVSTISHEYLLEFTFEYGILESLHPELPGPTDPIVEFPEGKVGVYTKFFEFANFQSLHPELPGPADPIVEFPEGKVGVYTKFFEFTNFRWMSFSKRPGKNTPQCYTKLLDSLKNWNNQFFWVDDRVFLTVADWRTGAPKDQMPSVGSYSTADVTILNTRRTPIQKQPGALLCLVRLSRLGDDVYPTFLYDDDRGGLISAPNPAKVKTMTRLCAAHEVSLLTATANRVIDMEDMTGASGSSGTPPTVEKSPLDFSNEDPPPLISERIVTEEQGQGEFSQGISPVGNPSYTKVTLEPDLEKETVAMGALVNKRRRKIGPYEAEANAPPKVLRKDHVASHFSQSILRGKSLADMGIGTVTEDPDSEKSASFTSMVGSPGGIYQSGWGVTSNCRLETLAACQDMVDHIVPPWYFLKLHHLPNDEFLNQYNTTLARQVAMGSQLRLRFEQETILLKRAVAQLSQQVSTLQAQVTGEERIKAAFEEFKKYKDDQVEKLKDAPIDVIMSSLYLESDSGKDASQWIRELCPSSSQLKIPVYPEKKKCQVVCRTHEVGFAHHARSDGVPVSVPTVAPQGLAILLADAATQTDITKDEASPKLLRSKSLPPMYNLDWL
nr:hypothetical protein [Tanacetum cinerariifolium]